MATVSRARLIERLQQETITITGLRSAFSSWPFRTNLHLSRVREEVEQMLVRRFRDHPKLQTLLRGDYKLFGATWWPCAEYKELLVATELSLWLFMWDDELDSDAGSLAQDFDQGQRYRAEIFQFVTNHLGHDDSTSLLHSSNSAIQGFDFIGAALRESCSIDQRKIFLKEFRFFMNKSETEQALRLRGSVDAEFVALWHWTNINICSVNDLLSVKKEILEVFIAGCRCYCTGNLTRSKSTGRYGVHQELGTDSVKISLAANDEEE
ncbi:isoprenoid synthase domain-containing protein [Aspergillus insuetus]